MNVDDVSQLPLREPHRDDEETQPPILNFTDADTDVGLNPILDILFDDDHFTQTFTQVECSMMRIYDYCKFIGVQRKAQDELLEIV
jgi:hypothetical protein